MKRPVILAAILIAITAAAFITVGLAYTASVENSDNTTPVEYVVLSQSKFTIDQNGLRLDTLSSDVGTAYILNYAEPLTDSTKTYKFKIDDIEYYGYAVGTDTLEVTSVGNAATSPIKVSLSTFGSGFKDFSDSYLSWRYVMKIEGKDGSNHDLLWYACYDGRPPALGSQDDLVGWTIYKYKGAGEWEEVSYLDVYFGSGIAAYNTTLYIAGPGESIRDGSVLKEAEDSVKATGNTTVTAVWIAKTDSDYKITLSSGSGSYEFYGWLKSDTTIGSIVAYKEGVSGYILPDEDVTSAGDYYAVYKIADKPAYKETYYEWAGDQYEFTATRDNDGVADRNKNVTLKFNSNDNSITTYYFVGWSDSAVAPASPEGHSATAYIAPGSAVSETSDHTFYAMYYITKVSGHTETYYQWDTTSHSAVGVTRENDGIVDRVDIEQFTDGSIYTFRGWKETNTAPTNTAPTDPPTGDPDYLPGQAIGTDSNHVFYALYQTAEEASLTETYYEWNGTGTTYAESSTLKYVSINDGKADLQRTSTIPVDGIVYAFRGWVAEKPSSVTDDLPRIAPYDDVDPTKNVSYWAVYIQVAVNYAETYHEWDGAEYSGIMTSISDDKADAPWTKMILTNNGATKYTFKGWYESETPPSSPTADVTTIKPGADIDPNANHNYYAIYTVSTPSSAAKYHEWNGAGYSAKDVGETGTGKAIDAIEKYVKASTVKNEKIVYISGSTYVLPDKDVLGDADQPTGKGFIGWSYNDKTYLPGQKLTSIKSDIEITAVWGSEVTIKYSAGIGKGTKNDDSVLPGTPWTLPAGTDFRYYTSETAPTNPEDDDMFFLGWAVIIGNNDPVYYNAGDKITVTYSMTLEAQYGYKVKFSSGHEGATGKMTPIIVEPGSTFILPNFGYSLEGHAPHHWMHDAQIVDEEHEECYSPGDQLIATMNVELRIQWATKYHTVSFDANNGTGTMDPITVVHGAKYVLPLSSFTPPASKYQMGWTIGSTDNPVYSVGDVITIDSDTTIVANWSTNEKVVIKYDHTEEGVTGDPVTFELAYGASFVLDNCMFSKTDHGFSKWKIGTTQYDPGTKIVSSEIAQTIDEVKTITITPVFNNTGIHTLKIISDDGTDRTYKLDNKAIFVLPNVYFTRTNYLSHEWICETVSGNIMDTTYHSPGDILTVGNNTDVMVEWAEILVDNKTYTIQFSPNYENSTDTMSDVTLAPKSAYVLPECGYTRNGYVFDRWMIANEEYAPGSVIAAVKETMTVKALWKKEVSVTVDYGCGNTKVTDKMAAGSWFDIPVNDEIKTGGPDEEDFGWLFKGWLVTVGDKWNTDTRYVAMSFISPVDSTGERDGYMIKDGTVKFIYDSNNQSAP